MPGRLISASGLPTLGISGIVTRSLEVREFINTERWGDSGLNNIILETPRYDFNGSGQEIKLYKISMNAKSIEGDMKAFYSIDGNAYEPFYTAEGNYVTTFVASKFTSQDLYFNDPRDIKFPILAKTLQIKITGLSKGFQLNDMSVVFRPKGGVK